MTISMDRQYQTSTGREVKLLMVDGGGLYPVIGAVHSADGMWVPVKWTKNGIPSSYGIPSGEYLIEIKPRIKREYWVNLYKDGESCLYPTKASASLASNLAIHQSCIARVKITIDCEEGEGLWCS